MPRRFGEKLRTLRIRQGMTLRALSKALEGISHSYIGMVENGERQPNAELIWQAAKFFNVTTDALLDDARDLDEG
jgi:transcriptional regulator with XRE-family HTH domain